MEDLEAQRSPAEVAGEQSEDLQVNRNWQEPEVHPLAGKDLLAEGQLVVARDEVNRKLVETVAERNLLMQEPSSLGNRLGLEQRSYRYANLADP